MSLPLAGVRVVSLALNLPGPHAANRLASLGADVVAVEPPSGDPMATYSPDWYTELHDGVRSVVLDVKAAPDALEELLADADVLVTAQRTAALARLGLGWDDLHARHPRLVHVAIVGHPAPHDDVAGHDLTYQAASGTLAPPAMPRVLGADLLGGERATTEALAGLALRDRTGEGSRREVALSDAALVLAGAARHGLTTTGLLSGALPTYALYEAADGWVALAALEPHFHARVQEALGTDTREGLAAAFRAQPVAAWAEWAAEHDIPLEVVR